MKRGEIYRVHKGSPHNSKKYRLFVVVSRQILIDSKFSTVICAPVYTRHDGLSTQVSIGIEEGAKHFSSIHCDELTSIRKSSLTHYVGSLSESKIRELDDALRIAVGLAE